MTARTAFTLAGILVVVAALSAIRFGGKGEGGTPAVPAPVTAAPPAPLAPERSPLLPSLLDFGRDT